MASLGFLLAPVLPIPAERDDAYDGRISRFCADVQQAWFERFEALPAEAQDWDHGVSPRADHNWGSLPSSALLLPADVREDIRARAAAWVEAQWGAWEASGRTVLPENSIPNALRTLGLPARISLADLLAYRGDGWQAVPADVLPSRGARHGYLLNRARHDEFGFDAATSEERANLVELARAYGGDHLAVWTFGHAVHVMLVRAPSPGATPTVYGPLSLRTTAPALPRPGSPLELLLGWFTGAALRPDWELLRQELGAPTVHVGRLFEAFGLQGAQELLPEDADRLWHDAEQAALTLLRGEAVEKAALARVNAVLSQREASLPAKPGKLGTGKVSDAVTAALHVLEEQLGAPQDPRLQARRHAAARFGALSTAPWGARLTTGTDKKGLGASASTGRLLGHFPRELARDPLFLALLGKQCEAWNSHGLAATLGKLAECAAGVGAVAIAVPAALRQPLREAFGIEAPDEGEAHLPAGPWAGELFLTHEAVLKADVPALLRAWLAQARADGVLAVLSPDGRTTVTRFEAGVEATKPAALGLPPPEEAALQQAAGALDVRAVFPALGVGDLLDPGPLPPEARPGEAPDAVLRGKASEVQKARELLADLPPVQRVRGWEALRGVCCGRLHLTSRNQPESEADALVALCLRIPGASERVLEELRADLASSCALTPWLSGGEVWAFDGGSVDARLLALVLADLPDGTRLSLAVGPRERYAWELRRP